MKLTVVIEIEERLNYSASGRLLLSAMYVSLEVPMTDWLELMARCDA